MKMITLQLYDQEDELVATVSAEFQDEDIMLFRTFACLMERVKRTTLLTRGFAGITNMKWEAGKGMVFTCSPYSNAELDQLLHVIRLVTLEEEKASFHKVLALMGRRFKDKTFAQHQKGLRHAFEEGEMSSYMQIHVGGQPLFHNSILKMWLNGTQYHSDQDKLEAWRKLEKALSENNARAIAIDLVHSRVKSLLFLDHMVNLVLGKHDA